MTNDSEAIRFLLLKTLSAKHPQSLYEPMREYPQRGGKGFRATLCLTTCKAYGGNPQDARFAASAIELFGNYALVHDDIEDGSLMRRGGPTLHVKFGVPLAINAGDGLLVKAWEMMIMNRTILKVDDTLRLLDEFRKMCLNAIEGQAIELDWICRRKWGIKENDYFEMIRKKTAWYTCIGPCRIGAIIANAQESEVEKIVDFATPMGVAYQLQDDILNVSQKEEIYGKEFAGDIYEGKRTLMIIRLVNLCTQQERKRIIDIMNRPREKKTTHDVNYIIELMEKYDCLTYAKTILRKLSVQSKKALKKLSLPDNQGRMELEHILRFSTNREK